MLENRNSQAQSLFRTAAIFYGNDPSNYGSTNVRNIQKLIEASLYNCTDTGLTLQEISDNIRNNFLLDIDTSEIANIIGDKRHSDKYISFTEHSETKFTLSQRRRISIETTQKAISLDSFIDEYVCSVSMGQDAKSIIVQYLYGLFTSNLESFRRLFQLKKAATLAIEINREYTEQETSIINGFLLWDNNDKDQAIFNFASYALEFCMITNRRDSANINDQLGQKEFYIDTNIVYRAIGLNGEDRKQRTLQLLDKLVATKCKLYITTEVKAELNFSLKDKFSRLRKDHNPRVKSALFQEFVTYDDIYSAYHRWCVGRVSTSIDTFEAYIMSSFDALRERYSIQTDGDCPFSKEENEEFINKTAAEIKSYSKRKTHSMAQRDAMNVKWVSAKRTPNQFSIFSAKHFLLSSDKGLRYWDVVRNNGNSPRIVIHPSEWLSLILRYSHRTTDDFKSFISFLTLRNNDAPMSNEELNIAISSIAELAENIEIQKTACENLLKISFERDSTSITEETIRELAKLEAERELERRLKQTKEVNQQLTEANNALAVENTYLKDTVETQSKQADDRVISLTQENELLLNKNSLIEKKANARIAELEEKLHQSENGRKRDKEEYLNNEANRITTNWIIARVICSLLLMLLVVFYISASNEGDWLYLQKSWIKNHEDIGNLLSGGLPSFVGLISFIIFPWRPIFRKYFSKGYSLGAFD